MEAEFVQVALRQHAKEMMSQVESLSTSPWDPRFTDGTRTLIAPTLLPTLILSSSAAPEQGAGALSRYRVHAAVHLLQENGPQHWNALQFGFNDWGPYSPALEEALSALTGDGLVEADRAGRLKLTPRGEQTASARLLTMPDRERALVRAARILALLAFLRA